MRATNWSHGGDVPHRPRPRPPRGTDQLVSQRDVPGRPRPPSSPSPIQGGTDQLVSQRDVPRRPRPRPPRGRVTNWLSPSNGRAVAPTRAKIVPPLVFITGPCLHNWSSPGRPPFRSPPAAPVCPITVTNWPSLDGPIPPICPQLPLSRPARLSPTNWLGPGTRICRSVSA